MYFKKKMANGYDQYLAVVRLERIRVDQEIYGQHIYRLTLSDGSTTDHAFEQAEWEAWQASIGKGGVVLNPLNFS